MKCAGRVACTEDEKSIPNFGRKHEGKNHLEDLSIDGENIKIYSMELGWEGVDWIKEAQNTDQWRALVNTAMYLRVP
jgi:hypothetical protein